jgi:hypothetical protein
MVLAHHGLHRLLWAWWRVQQKVCTCRNECNKYDLTSDTSVSDWPIIMIDPGGFMVKVYHTFVDGSFMWNGAC